MASWSRRNGECRWLASSGKDGTVRVWDVVLGQTRLTLSGHTRAVTCVRWGGSGLLYTASQDCTIKVWRADTVRARVWTLERGGRNPKKEPF